MYTQTELTMLKVNIGRLDPPDDVLMYMQEQLRAAEEAFAEKGVEIDHASAKDRELLVSYAAWLYRSRGGESEMPRSLSYAKNNRIVSAKVQR